MMGVGFSGRRDRGATLVEAAFVLPLLLILLLGIVDFGLAVADFNSLRQGDREAVRRAVVGNVGTDSSCTIGGVPPSTNTAELVCLTKAQTGLDPAVTQVAVAFDTSYTEGDALILCAQTSLSSITGLFGGLLDGVTVHSEVHMRIEKSTLDLQPFQESGGDGWSWCG